MKRMKNTGTRGTVSEVIDEDEGKSDKDAFRTTSEVMDDKSDTWGQNVNLPGFEEDRSSAAKNHITGIAVSEDEGLSDDEGFSVNGILAKSRHRDGSIYRGIDLFHWKEEYRIADRNETRLEAMTLSDPAANCKVHNGICTRHFARSMLQIYSLELAKIPVDGFVELYGYVAVRDDLDPLLNYVVNISRDDPVIVEQERDPHHPCQSGYPSTPPRRPTAPAPCAQTAEHVMVVASTPQHHAAKYHQPTQLEVSGRSVGSLINMIGPKRGIDMADHALLEYDMKIKSGEQEKDDLQLIDGASFIGPLGSWDQPCTFHIAGDCGSVDITLSRLLHAVEATVEVLILEVKNSFSLSVRCLASGFNEEIRLFDGTIADSQGLKRSVVAVMDNSFIDLKFKVKMHGHDIEEIKTDFALILVKVIWSTLPRGFCG
uniref:DUF6598 domain-containing protein n=1 Tax=Aegilops tauschii TaxID=37682 RepID=M8CVP4_AEGTA